VHNAIAGPAAKVRRAAESRAGQHTTGGRADGHLHIQYVHDNQRSLYRREQHDTGADHRLCIVGADFLPDGFHTGRFPTVVRYARPDTQEAWQGDRHVPVGQQLGHVGHQHAGEVSGRFAPHTASLLRPVGVDHHHARVHATGHILQVSLDRVPVRDLEAIVQDQTVVHVRAALSALPPLPKPYHKIV